MCVPCMQHVRVLPQVSALSTARLSTRTDGGSAVHLCVNKQELLFAWYQGGEPFSMGLQRAKRKAAEPPSAGPCTAACTTDIQQYQSAIEALQPLPGAQASHGMLGSRLADILT